MSKTNKLSIDSPNWYNIGGILLLITGIAFGGWFWVQNNRSSNSTQMSQAPATGVKLITLEPTIVQETTEVLGNLEASQTVELQPEIEGRLIDILVKQGQIVDQNELLFLLDSQTLEAELRQAKANLASRQAQLEELQTGSRVEDIAIAKARLRQAEVNLSNAEKGASPEEIAQAKAQLESAIAEANLAQQKVKRFEELREEGVISIDEFDNITTSAQVAKANVEQAKRRLQQLQQANNFNIRQLEAEVEEARQNLTRLQNGAREEQIAQAQGEVQSAQANIERLQSLLAKNAVKAPINGTVGNIPANIGDYVETDTVLTTITQNNLLELNFSLPIERLSELEIGLPVEILGLENQVLARGEINFISPNVTPDSQLVTAQAIFSNADRQLLNRQFITARVIWGESTGILVPTSAVFRIGSQSFVFVAQPNPESEGLIAEQRLVKLGKIQGNNYQILEGLNKGDKIVTEGILKLRDGSPIQELPTKE